MQENEFRSFKVHCITLSAHFVKKKIPLKSNINYNSATVIRTHVFTSAEIESFAFDRFGYQLAAETSNFSPSSNFSTDDAEKMTQFRQK